MNMKHDIANFLFSICDILFNKIQTCKLPACAETSIKNNILLPQNGNSFIRTLFNSGIINPCPIYLHTSNSSAQRT